MTAANGDHNEINWIELQGDLSLLSNIKMFVLFHLYIFYGLSTNY